MIEHNSGYSCSRNSRYLSHIKTQTLQEGIQLREGPCRACVPVYRSRDNRQSSLRVEQGLAHKIRKLQSFQQMAALLSIPMNLPDT